MKVSALNLFNELSKGEMSMIQGGGTNIQTVPQFLQTYYEIRAYEKKLESINTAAAAVSVSVAATIGTKRS
ncbi:hypothetical protein QTL86_17780 [Cellulosilyticum sp. ST5]|uniref:hypothetical protein n=1 Tax=unclassified Cellulosilyticum TaxID=2643091 RepID=UPI000F8E93AB|nr:hypothetical protein [Cellulosilyticum sp. WCF-2]QEH67502.1 hypothetical protein EKH84_03365 [Cellulosilyticum sp. WCF-2]